MFFEKVIFHDPLLFVSLGEIQQLLQLENPDDYVSSVKWIKEGNILAVGNAFGEVALWDIEQIKKVLVSNPFEF